MERGLPAGIFFLVSVLFMVGSGGCCSQRRCQRLHPVQVVTTTTTVSDSHTVSVSVSPGRVEKVIRSLKEKQYSLQTSQGTYTTILEADSVIQQFTPVEYQVQVRVPARVTTVTRETKPEPTVTPAVKPARDQSAQAEKPRRIHGFYIFTAYWFLFTLIIGAVVTLLFFRKI
jgi:hypothetical protein